MKRFYHLSGNINSSLTHLGASILAAFFAMLFVNVFIGGMGGIPVFAAFFLEYYLLRAMVLAENRIGHHLTMESKAEVRYYLIYYAVGYLLVWAIMKLVIIVSRISGWGNIAGLAFGEYVDYFYGSTMLEVWAYLFAGIFMFAYVMSLFPLIVIRQRRQWMGYLVLDSGFFVLVCGIIAFICNFFIKENKRGRAACVLDDMLLCDIPQKWQAGAYIVIIILFALAVLTAVYQISVKIYSPKPGKTEWKDVPVKSWRDYRVPVFAALGVVVILAAGVGYYFFGSRKDVSSYEKVAECLTEDSVLGPMVYQDTVYLPVDGEWDLTSRGKELGYLGYKDENCESRFYELVIGNLLYQDKSFGEEYLQMQGADSGRFERADILLSKKEWQKDELILLWDEKWVREMDYSNSAGYSVCDPGLIEGLEQDFPEISMNPEDFSDYDAYFTIRSYEDMKDAFDSETIIGNWVGCILVKDNKFYYGSYENQITGLRLQQLLDVLGGY